MTSNKDMFFCAQSDGDYIENSGLCLSGATALLMRNINSDGDIVECEVLLSPKNAKSFAKALLAQLEGKDCEG